MIVGAATCDPPQDGEPVWVPRILEERLQHFSNRAAADAPRSGLLEICWRSVGARARERKRRFLRPGLPMPSDKEPTPRRSRRDGPLGVRPPRLVALDSDHERQALDALVALLARSLVERPISLSVEDDGR